MLVNGCILAALTCFVSGIIWDDFHSFPPQTFLPKCPCLDFQMQKDLSIYFSSHTWEISPHETMQLDRDGCVLPLYFTRVVFFSTFIYLCVSVCSNRAKDGGSEQVSGCTHHSPVMKTQRQSEKPEF
ncbi:hypothetical protein ILYODFUR_002551 [Ilyodon furcidens]|uniref:Uncharacterized protein n=1 Tax=Ilyodon furcidens TaxID=33524 RepID=A0ABV0USE3_9TELE